MTFGQRIKELREDSGLSQTETSEAIGCARSTLANYESGARDPSFEMLLNIASWFGVTTDYLLGLEE